MLTLKFSFKCIFCEKEDQDWYIMPIEEKTATGDKINSLTRYKLICKECGQKHEIEIKIKGI